MTKIEYAKAQIEHLLANPTDRCVLWPYTKTQGGYGIITVRVGRKNSTSRCIHRMALEMKLGRPIPKNMDAAHSCRSRACYNPQHVSEKTRKENIADTLKDGTSRRYLGLQRNNTSKYRGVSYYRNLRKWVAHIAVNGQQRYLGVYDTAVEAAKVRDAVAREYWGHDCFQNFPEYVTKVA